MTPKPLKLKKCVSCKQLFQPARPLQHLCGYDCAVAYSNTLAEKNNRLDVSKSRKETKEKLDKLKPKKEWLQDAQKTFNLYIRLRDAALPCISCQRFHSGQYHAGHYRSVGASTHLRFNENNVHKQCSACNNHLSGNIVNYRINLVHKIGIEEVEKLESDNEPKHYSIDDIKAIKLKYKLLIKEINEGV